jgi:hypothetical protein
MLEPILKADPRFQAAIVAAIITLITLLLGTPLKYLLDRNMIKHKLMLEYKYEQKKKLHQLIGEFHGRLLDSVVDLNYRLFNLYENEGKGWLNPDKSFYYYSTTMYRFLHVFSLIRLFESKATYIDSRIATKKDFEFIKLLKALNWVCIDVKLYDGLPYDISKPTDHFLNDELKLMCDQFISENQMITLEEFQKIIKKKNNKFTPLMDYFLDLNKQRLKWDRVICLHLFLMVFINAFGYDMQKSKSNHFKRVISQVNNDSILKNLDKWFMPLGLAKQKEIKKMRKLFKMTFDGTNGSRSTFLVRRINLFLDFMNARKW